MYARYESSGSSSFTMSAVGTVLNEDDGPRPGQQIIDVILPTYIMKPDETEM
jgi:hypothetical protein